MALDVSVRTMRADEWAAARAVAVDAFGDDPQIETLLDLMHASWSWVDDLAFVAEHLGDVVGMVIFTPAFVDCSDRVASVLVLSPLAVATRHQRSGVGAALMRTTLLSLHSRPEPLVFLEGIPAYYPQFGFRRASTLGFTPPSSRIPDAAFMAYPLPAYDPSIRGSLVYPDVFWRADAVGLRE